MGWERKYHFKNTYSIFKDLIADYPTMSQIPLQKLPEIIHEFLLDIYNAQDDIMIEWLNKNLGDQFKNALLLVLKNESFIINGGKIAYLIYETEKDLLTEIFDEALEDYRFDIFETLIDVKNFIYKEALIDFKKASEILGGAQ